LEFSPDSDDHDLQDTSPKSVYKVLIDLIKEKNVKELYRLLRDKTKIININ